MGKPLYMDRATASGERLAYAWCFVEVTAAKTLPNRLTLEDEEGETQIIDVEYEWVPSTLPKMCLFWPLNYPTVRVWKPIGSVANDRRNGEGSGGVESGMQDTHNSAQAEDNLKQTHNQLYVRTGLSILLLQD